MANKIPRVPVREQDPKVRATNFEEVCYGYNVEEAQLEASRCLNCKNPRCVAACPVSVKIPTFVSLVAEGKFAEAAAVKLPSATSAMKLGMLTLTGQAATQRGFLQLRHLEASS